MQMNVKWKQFELDVDRKHMRQKELKIILSGTLYLSQTV